MWWMFCCAATFFAFLPLYLKQLGFSSSETAVVLAMPALASLFSSQVWGYIADMKTTRIAVLLTQCLGGAACAIAYTVVPGTVPALAPMLFVHSLCVSARMSMLNSIIFASKGGEAAYGRIRVSGSVSFGVCALLVGVVVDRMGEGFGIIWPMLFVFEILTALCCLAVKDLPPAARAEVKQRVSFREAQRILLSNRAMRAFLVFAFATQFTLFAGQYMQVRFMNELGASTGMTMWTFALGVIAETFVFVFAQRRLQRMPILIPMAVGAGSIALRWGLVWLFPTPVPILLTNLLHMFSFGVAYLVAVIFIQQQAPPELKSSGQAILSLAYFSLPNLFGLLTAGLLLHYMDLRTYYGVSAMLGLVAMLTLLPLRRALREQGR